MMVYTATLFLPSPAVPYVRFSLLIVTRWKPLPPRHSCDTQAHRFYPLGSCLQRPFAKSGYVVQLHFRYYGLSRHSDRILPISVFNPYTVGLCHSLVDPDFLSELPQFTLRFLLYMPISLPRRIVSLLLSVSSRNAAVFARFSVARLPISCPRHFLPVSRRTACITRLQYLLYVTACRFARSTAMAPSTFVKVWSFYFRAFPHSVTLLRVGYNYLGVQTIPRVGLSPTGNTALWAAQKLYKKPYGSPCFFGFLKCYR